MRLLDEGNIIKLEDIEKILVCEMIKDIDDYNKLKDFTFEVKRVIRNRYKEMSFGILTEFSKVTFVEFVCVETGERYETDDIEMMYNNFESTK